MAERPKLSFRLTPEIQAALAVRVGQGQTASDVIREALEQYLGMRPTFSPTESPTAPQVSDLMSDALSDLSARVAALTTALLDIEARIERLEVREMPPQQAVRQQRTARPTPSSTGADREADTAPPRRGQRKLTPRQVRALRDKRHRGVSVEALMDEYALSRASVFRYLQSEKR